MSKPTPPQPPRQTLLSLRVVDPLWERSQALPAENDSVRAFLQKNGLSRVEPHVVPVLQAQALSAGLDDLKAILQQGRVKLCVITSSRAWNCLLSRPQLLQHMSSHKIALAAVGKETHSLIKQTLPSQEFDTERALPLREVASAPGLEACLDRHVPHWRQKSCGEGVGSEETAFKRVVVVGTSGGLSESLCQEAAEGLLHFTAVYELTVPHFAQAAVRQFKDFPLPMIALCHSGLVVKRSLPLLRAIWPLSQLRFLPRGKSAIRAVRDLDLPTWNSSCEAE